MKLENLFPQDLYYIRKNLVLLISGMAKRRPEPVDLIVYTLLTSFPTLLRFFIALIFVGSFLIKPLVMRPVNLVWRRVVESDKPVFTLVFGGAAAFATAIGEAAKHL
jgi:hypothetical protein